MDGKELKALRIKLRMSVWDISRKLGYAQTASFYSFERGDAPVPPHIAALVEAMVAGVDVNVETSNRRRLKFEAAE